MKLKSCPFCGSNDIGLNKKKEENMVLKNGTFKIQTVSERFQIKCRNCPCGTYFAFYVEDAIEAWNRRSAASWIPVEDRLPEVPGLYMVTVKNDHERIYSKTAWYHGQGNWFVRQSVTHWMPLPEPPKEDE